MDRGFGKSRFSRRTEDNGHVIDVEYEKPLWVTGNTYIMDSSLCVLKGLVGMLDIGIYGSLLAKKFRNLKTDIYGYEINANC